MELKTCCGAVCFPSPSFLVVDHHIDVMQLCFFNMECFLKLRYRVSSHRFRNVFICRNRTRGSTGNYSLSR